MIGNKHGTATRSAFTLIELLVVIGIIAILASLLGAAVMKMIPTQVRKNTEMTVRKLNGLLQRQWKAVLDQARDETRSNKVSMGELQLAAGDTDRLRVIHTKLRLKQQFPMSYTEALNPDGTFDLKTRSFKYIGPEQSYGLALQGKSSTSPNAQMAACLLLALTSVNRAGVSQDADVLSSLETRDTDGDGVLEIVDGWGTPLGFYRWTFGNLPANITAPSATLTFKDPEDPLGRLLAPGWSGASTFATICHPISNQFTMPVIVSAGPDRLLGYQDAYMTPLPATDPNAGANNDNILSYDLR